MFKKIVKSIEVRRDVKRLEAQLNELKAQREALGVNDAIDTLIKNTEATIAKIKASI